MKQGKETRTKEAPNREPSFEGFSYDEFFNNRLSLTEEIKSHLSAKDLDWRFINSSQFRANGNSHRSHWKPYKFEGIDAGQNAEGYVMRGDLILAARPKTISANHKKFLKERNNRLNAFNRVKAQEMRQSMKDAGVQGRVIEGYEENE